MTHFNGSYICTSTLLTSSAILVDVPWQAVIRYYTSLIPRHPPTCIRGTRSAGGRASKPFLPPIDLVSTEAKISCCTGPLYGCTFVKIKLKDTNINETRMNHL